MQPDLFGPPPLAGLATVADIVTPGEEGRLTAAIDAAPLSPFRYQGWEGRRLTATFGWRYDFEDGSFRPAEPIPDWLLPLRDKAARFAGLGPSELAQALLIRYDPGAGIGWHKDRPVFEHVVGISLGAAATLRLRRRRPEGGFDRRSAAAGAALRLPPGRRGAARLGAFASRRWPRPAGPSPSAACPDEMRSRVLDLPTVGSPISTGTKGKTQRMAHTHHHHPDHHPAHHHHPATPPAAAPAGTIYTCPMHPQIRQEGPGSCPICGMALEPERVTAEAGPNPELADMRRRFWIGLALTIPIVVLEMGGHLARHRHRPCDRRPHRGLDPAGPGHAGGALGRLAVPGPRLAVGGPAQPEHVHADRARHRRRLALQPGRDPHPRAVPGRLPRHGRDRGGVFRAGGGDHRAGAAGPGAGAAGARAHRRRHPRPARPGAEAGPPRARRRIG